MKKKTSGTSKNFSYVTLYRDDLEKIYAIFNNISDQVYFEIDEYIIDSVSEISQIPIASAKMVLIKVEKPYIKFEKSFLDFSLYASEDDIASENVVLKISELVTSRKNLLAEFFGEKAFSISLPVFFIGLLLSFISGNSNIPIPFYIGIFLSVISCFILIISLIVTVTWGSRNKIMLAYKKDKPSFWARKKDDIILNIIVAIVSFLIGKFLN